MLAGVGVGGTGRGVGVGVGLGVAVGVGAGDGVGVGVGRGVAVGSGVGVARGRNGLAQFGSAPRLVRLTWKQPRTPASLSPATNVPDMRSVVNEPVKTAPPPSSRIELALTEPLTLLIWIGASPQRAVGLSATGASKMTLAFPAISFPFCARFSVIEPAHWHSGSSEKSIMLMPPRHAPVRSRAGVMVVSKRGVGGGAGRRFPPC